jgi:coproporphyrinogen III oxidase
MGTAEFDALAFTRAVGDGILPSWLPIAEKRAHLPFSEAQRNWQELRRGRYIEFNLLYDRGIKFGLAGGRIESIMVSAPPRVQWQYMKSISPEPGSPEADMLSVLREPIGWV